MNDLDRLSTYVLRIAFRLAESVADYVQDKKEGSNPSAEVDKMTEKLSVK